MPYNSFWREGTGSAELPRSIALVSNSYFFTPRQETINPSPFPELHRIQYYPQTEADLMRT